MSSRRVLDYSRNKPGANGTSSAKRATPQPSINPNNAGRRGSSQSPNQTPPGTAGKAGGRDVAAAAASTSRRPSATSVMSDSSDFVATIAAGKKEHYPSDNYDVSFFVLRTKEQVN